MGQGACSGRSWIPRCIHYREQALIEGIPIIPDEAGVQHAIGLLRDEVGRNLTMLGATACTNLGLGTLFADTVSADKH